MSYQPGIYKEQGGNVLVVKAWDGASIKSQSAAAATPAQTAHIADAVVAHDLNSTFSDTEAEAALDALGAKVNAILVALENAGITARS